MNINLRESSSKQVFDFIKNHLLTQGERSVDESNNCLYRSGNLKCAAGCLLSDEDYDPNFEGDSWDTLAMKGSVPVYHARLIEDLQFIHDWNDPDKWEYKLKEFASDNNLRYE